MSSRENKQQEILLAAANHFLHKGYERTTIEDITNALGINKAMLYYYFPDKQSVLFDVIKSSISTMLIQTRAIARLKVSPKEKLDLVIQNHLIRFTDAKAVPYVAQSELRNLSPKLLKRCIADRDKYEAIFRSLIKDGITAGQFRNVDVSLVTFLILGMLNSVILWYKNDGRLSMTEIKETVNDLLNSYLTSPSMGSS